MKSKTYATWSARSSHSPVPAAWRMIALALMVIFMAAPALAGVPAGKPDITLVFTSDTRGMLRRCGCAEGQMGGISARATVIRQIRDEGVSLVLDAGDTLFDEFVLDEELRDFHMIKSMTIFDAMKSAGYDAVAVGEYDLAHGWEFLKDISGAERMKLTAANLTVDADGRTFRPFTPVVYECLPDLHVGVIGLLGPGFPYSGFGKPDPGYTVSDPLKAASAEVEGFGGKVDLVVVLAHFSVEPVEEFVKAFRGADVVIAGHSQEILEEPLKIGDTLFVKGFNKGKHLGRLSLWLADKKGGGKKITGYDYEVVTLDESVPPDPDVEDIITRYRKKLAQMAFVFQRPGPEGAGFYTGPDVCKSCHPAEYENWASTSHADSFFSLVNTGDHYDPECLPCHTTGYGYASGYRPDREKPKLHMVSCESCHGRGSGHASIGLDGAAPVKMDTSVTKEVSEETCRGCHDEENSPHFDYGRYLEMGGAHLGPVDINGVQDTQDMQDIKE